MTLEPTPSLWDQWISPATLLDQVRNTVPFLFPGTRSALPGLDLHTLAAAPDGFLLILRQAPDLIAVSSPDEQLLNYFALCLASHHATVASFVPTDVDSKIRGILWRETKSPEVLVAMLTLAEQMNHWSLHDISHRWDTVENSGPISGHNGEWLSVMVGALGRLTTLGFAREADQAAAAIDDELNREAVAFRIALDTPGAELLTLRLCMSITHNLGDLDQGISFWDSRAALAPYRARFGRLAHENAQAYEGTFQRAADLYRRAMATEGHRHYPLRAVRALRRSPDFLLPLSPFLDDWGTCLATHRDLSLDDRAEVIEALVSGCKKVPNQQGYFRALAGMQAASESTFSRAVSMCANSTQKLLRDPKLRQRIAIPRISFESMMKKKVHQLRTE